MGFVPQLYPFDKAMGQAERPQETECSGKAELILMPGPDKQQETQE